MHKRILKFYIAEVLQQEAGYWRKYSIKSVPTVRKKKGILQKIKDLFSSRDKVEKLVDEWLEDQLYYYDFDPTDDQLEDINAYAQVKWKRAVTKAQGDEDRAKSIMMTVLDKKYKKLIMAAKDSDEEDT